MDRHPVLFAVVAAAAGFGVFGLVTGAGLALALVAWKRVGTEYREAWVLRVVSNAAIDRARKRHRQGPESQGAGLGVAYLRVVENLIGRQAFVANPREFDKLPCDVSSDKVPCVLWSR